MLRDLRQTVIAALAVLMLSAAGLLSALHMAPDRADAALFRTVAATGLAVGDLCGTDGLHDDHACPFCHKLPSPPRAVAPDRFDRIAWDSAAPLARDLVAGPRHNPSDLAARAPPRRT